MDDRRKLAKALRDRDSFDFTIIGSGEAEWYTDGLTIDRVMTVTLVRVDSVLL